MAKIHHIIIIFILLSCSVLATNYLPGLGGFDSSLDYYLPIPGFNSSLWGDMLNGFLLTGHTETGIHNISKIVLVSTPSYLYRNESYIGFNETTLNATIEAKLATIYYNVSNITIVTGASEGGLYEVNNDDDNSFNLTEVTGANGIDLRFNFTNVTSFNEVIYKYKTSGGEDQLMKLKIYNFIDNVWDTHDIITSATEYITEEIGVFDSAEHISANDEVYLRFIQDENGNINHIHLFDWVTIAKGPSTPSNRETDPYFKDEIGNYYNKTETNITITEKSGWNNTGTEIKPLLNKICYNQNCTFFSNSTGNDLDFWYNG